MKIIRKTDWGTYEVVEGSTTLGELLVYLLWCTAITSLILIIATVTYRLLRLFLNA